MDLQASLPDYRFSLSCAFAVRSSLTTQKQHQGLKGLKAKVIAMATDGSKMQHDYDGRCVVTMSSNRKRNDHGRQFCKHIFCPSLYLI